MADEKPWPLVLAKDDGIRPAGPPDACFYCNQKVGQPHTRSCVCVQKVVKVRFAVDLDLRVPYDWKPTDVDFRYQDSTWCGDNILDLAREQLLVERAAGGCLCPRVSGSFLEVVDPGPIQQPPRSDAQVDDDNHRRLLLTPTPTRVQ